VNYLHGKEPHLRTRLRSFPCAFVDVNQINLIFNKTDMNISGFLEEGRGPLTNPPRGTIPYVEQIEVPYQ